jgi:UDP-N-acetylglucosamine 4-epimerase
LRYFNVFGRRQDPDGAYAAVIPKFVKLLIQKESPVINGDGTYSRDFTYIDNVIQMNALALSATKPEALNTVYNTAVGEQISLNEMVHLLKKYLSRYDASIAEVPIVYGPQRVGDIPHSKACIAKAQELLGYKPQYNFASGLKEAVAWYWYNLK